MAEKQLKPKIPTCLVRLNKDNIIINKYVGDQTEKNIIEAISENEFYAKVLRENGKQVNTLVDVSKVGKIPINSQKIALESLKNKDFGKISFVGGGIFFKELVAFLGTALGLSKKIRYFDSIKDAEKWLKE